MEAEPHLGLQGNLLKTQELQSQGGFFLARRVSQCVQLFCASVNRSLPGSSAHGILQARILEWVAIPFSKGFSQPRDRIPVSCIAGRFFTTELPGKPSYWLNLALLLDRKLRFGA